MDHVDCLSGFNPVVRDWFLEHIGEPSEPQSKGWPEIAAGRNVLICAPTGSGKTFAAFLKCLDWIYTVKDPEVKNTGIKIVYISPLKALNNDIYRNLELPIKGIGQKAGEMGISLPGIEVAVRTGDTPQKDRSRMLKNPPDILITTPESLFIMLTSASSRKIFSTVEYIIVDEIHSICANKRGVHLSVSVERLERLTGKPLKRIGLSATINPLEEAACFLAGNRVIEAANGSTTCIQRDVAIVNCDRRRSFELSVSLPVKDLKVLPENTVWPAIYSQLLALINTHKSTLVFVNNRRTAELVASGLNRLAGEPFVKTHHGSMSKEVRQELEKQLKEGEISCVVATSSLELGIDIGSIELVVQVSAPGSVSQVLQRIGRSGHNLNAISKGSIIPKTRGDLLNAAFISSQARQFNVESIKVPQNCLDILAQQVTSMVCEDEADIFDIYKLVRHAYPFRELPFRQFQDVLEMLADPSPEDTPGSVKPRIAYEKGIGKVRGTPLGRRMCLMSGGTILDKGNYTVYLQDTNIKLGELQEEFVFESRLGERFFLGSSVWRLEKVERDRVIVSPSSDSGAKIPFWMGDKVMRTYETGVRLGSFMRKLEEKYESTGFHRWIGEESGLDSTASENLRQYIADQVSETGHLPCDHLIICEYFSDEVGDRRIIIHSPFGGKVHAALAVVLHSKLIRLVNCRMEYVHNDDGILFHIVGYTGKLANIFSLLTRENIEDEIFEQLPQAPLFNINLRYNLTRSLLIETKGFGKRTPLWIQRLKSAEVAQSVLSKPDHPVVVETYRECMNDIFDIKNLYALIENIASGSVKVLDVYSEKPSPFSAELLFNFWQIYQYAYDLPVAERRNQLLVNDRDFIQLAAGVNSEYELIDPRAVKAVEKELHSFKYHGKVRNADELYYFLHSFGELKAEPYSSSLLKELGEEACEALLASLEDQGRIMRMRIDDTGDRYWIAAEDYPLYCKVMGLDMHSFVFTTGLPGKEIEVAAREWFNSYILQMEPDETEAAARILRRHILCIGLFTAADIAGKYAMKHGLAASALTRLVSTGEIVRLKESDRAEEVVYCHAKVYTRIRKKTVMLARSDIKPKNPDVYCSFLFEYHGLYEDVLPPDEKLAAIVGKLQGLFLPAGWWEDFIFPSRIRKYDTKLLDYLCSMGLVRWVGRINKSTREVAFYLTHESEDGTNCGIPMSDAGFTLDVFEEGVCSMLRSKGACFLKDLSKQAGISPPELLSKMERLVWSGTVTNDSFTVARYYMEVDRKNSPWVKYNTAPNMGRWCLVEGNANPVDGKRLWAYINRMLDRYGILSKDIADCEKELFKWNDVYTYLKNNEFSSGIKRGFYVMGLKGIQFARDRELELMRMQDTPGKDARYLTLCTCDPANPYKDILSKASPVKITKNQGTAIVFRDGVPVLAIKDYGSWLVSLTEDCYVVEKAVGCFMDSFNSRSLWATRKSIFTEYWGDGKTEGEGYRIEDSPIYQRLLDMGFDRGYNGITFWRKAI